MYSRSTEQDQGRQGLPPQVRGAIAESLQGCEGKLTLNKRFSTRRDINGDGVNDFILNYEHAECGASSTSFCGTGGCTFQVFASLPDGGYVKVMGDNAYDVRFERLRGRPAMIQLLHGIDCGRSGASGPCRSVTYWNGFQFSPAVPVR